MMSWSTHGCLGKGWLFLLHLVCPINEQVKTIQIYLNAPTSYWANPGELYAIFILLSFFGEVFSAKNI